MNILTSLKELPAGRRILFALIAIVVLGFVGYWALGKFQAWNYNRARAAFEQKEREWTTERARLIAEAEAKERRIAELEPQVMAYKAAAEEGKRLDEAKAKEIEALAVKTSQEEANANVPVDCRLRASRLCSMFRATDRSFDCDAITRQCDRQPER